MHGRYPRVSCQWISRRRPGRIAGLRTAPADIADGPSDCIIGVSILVVVVLALGLGGWFYVNSVLGSIKRFPVSGLTPETPGAPIDILLVGSDSQGSSSATPVEVASFGNPLTQTGQRSDVIIVMRLVPKTHQIEMLSIPRDTYVPIPGTGGSNRINAAFNTGPTVLVKTIQQNFGIPINHVVVANFPGFQGMVNALGGISPRLPLSGPRPVLGAERHHAGMPDGDRARPLSPWSAAGTSTTSTTELAVRRA